ncbi:MAG: hypothetical protein OXE96_04405 [Gemmatimonadetes bacterium]|nr:hypothetical protein [Gemmatimonadota bacterium]
MPRKALIGIVAPTAVLVAPASASCRDPAEVVEKLTPVDEITAGCRP